MAWQRLTVCVIAGKSGEDYAIGTGFPVAPGKILTARHVVRPEDAADSVLIRWWHSDEPGFRKQDGEGGDGFLPGEIIWECEALDVALLEAPHPPNFGYIYLTSADHRPGDCTGEGFPMGARVGDRTEHFRIAGRAHSLDGTGPYFQVDLDIDAVSPTAWGGASGAALIDERAGTALGLLVAARHAFERSGTGRAIPGSTIWKAPGFARHAGQNWRAHEPSAAWRSGLRKELEKLLAAHLAKFTAQQRNELLHCCGFANAAGLAADSISAAAALARDCAQSIDRIREHQKRFDDGANEPMCDQIGLVAWFVAMLDLDEDALRLVAYMAEWRDNPNTLPVGGPACTLTLLELIAAAIDTGSPDFAERAKDASLPQGKYCLPFVAPEGGPGSDEVAAFVEHLRDRLGAKSSAAQAAVSSIELYLSSDELPHVGPVKKIREGEELDDLAASDLRFALVGRKADRQRSYYVPVVMPPAGDDIDRLRDNIHRLRQKYPEIMALSLNPSLAAANRERERLMRLIWTVRRRKEST